MHFGFSIAINYNREEFAQTLPVRGTVRGRAPVVVSEGHVSCVDRGGMNICLYAYDNAQFPSKGTLQVSYDITQDVFATHIILC